MWATPIPEIALNDHPKLGAYTIARRIEIGEKELDDLVKLAMKGDKESYYLAVFVGNWLLENARLGWGNGPPTARIQNDVIEKMDKLHQRYAGSTPEVRAVISGKS